MYVCMHACMHVCRKPQNPSRKPKDPQSQTLLEIGMITNPQICLWAKNESRPWLEMGALGSNGL